MKILTQEQLLLNAQEQFCTLQESILNHSQQQTRIDQVERNLFARPSVTPRSHDRGHSRLGDMFELYVAQVA